MRIGSVVAPGPEVKLAITRSSSDRVKASIQPDTIAGMITGSVTWKKVLVGVAPRSIAASSSDRSKLRRRDCTTTATKHIEKVTWASVTVNIPRSSPIATNSNSSDRPVMTSGMTSGAKTIPENRKRPRKRGYRVSARAAIVPRTVATVAEMTAMRNVTQAASISCWLENNDTYQRVEKPPQTVTSLEALNE